LYVHVSVTSGNWLPRLPSVVLIDIGANRGCQQAGGGNGSSTEKQCSSKKRTGTAEGVPSEYKTVTVEPVGGNNKTGTATNPKNWQFPPKPLSGRQGEDSADSDNISSSVSLHPQKGGKHSGIYADGYVLLASVS
jgi:hypothetical protein